VFIAKRSNGIYYVHYCNTEGKRTKISTGTSIKSEAIKFLTQFEKELEERRAKKIKIVLLKEHCKNFLEYSRTIHTNKTHNGYKLTLSYITDYFKDIPIKDITQKKLGDYFEQRINKSSIYQARKDLICLKSFFNRAIVDSCLISNPCKNIKQFRIPQKQPLFFTELQLELLIKTIKNKI